MGILIALLLMGLTTCGGTASPKQFANGAALAAGAADFPGQLCVTADGVAWSIARSTIAGETVLPLVCLNTLHYFTAITVSGATLLGGAAQTKGITAYIPATEGFIDNVINILNRSGGLSTIAAYRPEDDNYTPVNAASFTVGYGPGATRGSPGAYNDRVIFAAAPIGGIEGTVAPPDVLHTWEGNFASGGAFIHWKHFENGVTKDRTWYAIEDGAEVGAVAMRLKKNGDLVLGGVDATANARLTVIGGIHSSTFLQLTPTANPPSSAVEGMIYADTDQHLYYYNGTTWLRLDNLI